MQSLDEWIVAVTKLMADAPMHDAIRVHPEDIKELRKLSAPVNGGMWSGAFGGWGIQRFYMDGLPVIEDKEAERLPRK